MTEPRNCSGVSITAAEHRELANRRFAQMSAAEPGTKPYSDLAWAAIAHCLAAIELHLEPPPPAPAIPGLPDGWAIDVQPGPTGKWGYVLTGPDGRTRLSPKPQFNVPETALANGIRQARLTEAQDRTRNQEES